VVDITIVGLGPGRLEQLTLEAWQVLQEASVVYLRTSHHPMVDDLDGMTLRSFDELYESLDSFSDVYEAIVQRVIELAQQPGGIVYGVPGHPLVGESTVALLVERAEEKGLSLRIVDGVSFIEPILTALELDPFDGLQISDATLLAQRHHPNLDPDVGALIVQVYNRQVAGDLKMTLMSQYPDEHPLRVVIRAGMADQIVRDIKLFELDRQQDLDHLTSIYAPPLARLGSISTYQDVMARLRAPDGCPWDREQTHLSLRGSLLEETYEVLEALDAEDTDGLKEELGDLLLQILFHAQIAVEDGDFHLADTIAHSVEKLMRRHPHVFADEQINDADGVLRSWEEIKRAERGEETFVSMLSGLNKALPALAQAREMQSRVARVGFDWPNVEPVLTKVKEEIDEFVSSGGQQAQTHELGDMLFSLVNVARWYEIDPESALREANARFAQRFAFIETQAASMSRSLEEMTLEEMDRLWDEAKAVG